MASASGPGRRHLAPAGNNEGQTTVRKRRSVLAGLAIMVCASAAALVLFEFGVRLLEPQPETPYHFSPDTYYAPIPDADFVYRRQEFSIPVRFNHFGMRDRPRALQKAPGTLRVALLGDSFAEALQVPDDSTLARLLEKDLGACLQAPAVEVLNFGVSGFGPVASAAHYHGLASRFAPDLVVYLFVANDVMDLVTAADARLYRVEDGQMVLQRVELGRMRALRQRAVDWIKVRSHAYRFLKWRWIVWHDRGLVAVARARADSAATSELLLAEEDWQRAGQALTLLQSLVEDAGAELLVVAASTYGPEMDRRLAALCASRDIALHDLMPALRADPGPVYFRIDGHWRARGHRVANHALSPAVCRLLQQLEPPPGSNR